MTSSLASLKKNSSLTKLAKKLQETTASKSSRDDRYWQPEVDKAGNGFAIIRFLDAPFADGDDGMPWVQLFTHGFQGPGGWYIENSLTTLGAQDPVSEHNSTLWDSGIEANKQIARNQKRRLSYISNILVVKDSAHPENEGKVFLYSYGKKIFDKIKTQIDPTEEEIAAAQLEDITLTPVNVFSFWEGLNFKLKIRKVEGYRNYDKSEFDQTPSAVAKTDAEIEKIWKSAHSLKAVVAPDQFKTYADLEKKLHKVLGLDGSKPATKSTVKSTPAEEDSTPPFDADTAPVGNPKIKVAAKAAAVSRKNESLKGSPDEDKIVDTDSDDSMLSMFKDLADAE